MAKVKRDSWRIHVEIDREDWEGIQVIIERAVGYSAGSGYDLYNGVRDLDWYRASERTAVHLAKRIKKVAGRRKGVTIQVEEKGGDEASYFV